MADFCKYSDGSVYFEERELSEISKFLGKKQIIIGFIANDCGNIQEVQDFVSAVVKINKAKEIWEEKKKGGVEEIG